MGRFIQHYGVYDPQGFKKIIYIIADLIRGKKYRKAEYVSSYIKHIEENYLNHNHKTWHNPASKEKSHSSIDELYQEALDKCVKIIKKIDTIIKQNKDLKSLKQIIPNISYLHGLEIDKKYKLRYFEN